MSMIYFIYQNEKYPIDLKLLISHSEYFAARQSKTGIRASDEFISLFDEFESPPKINKESIKGFIQYFKTEEIELNTDNIFSIKYLSTKYEISKLQHDTEKYVKNEYKTLIDQILNNINDIDEEKEKLLSFHIFEYLNDDRLPSLPIGILYRIFRNNLANKEIDNKNQKKNKKQASNDEENNLYFKKVDFFIETINRQGIDASILFNVLNIENKGIEYLIHQICLKNIDIDIGFIKSNITKYISYKNEEYKKEKERNEEKIKDMHNNFSKAISNIREEILEVIEEMKREHEKEISDLKEEHEKEISNLKEEHEKEISDLKEELVKEISDFKKEISNLKYFFDLLKYLSEENLKSKNPIRITESIFIPNEKSSFLEIIGFHSNAFEMLYSNESFDSSTLRKIIKNFSKVIFELRSSSLQFDELLENIGREFHLMRNNSICIEVVFDGQEINKITKNQNYIDLIKINPTISIIGENVFENYSSITNVVIPSTIVKIDSKSFKDCLSLIKISIPSSVISIGNEVFKGCTSLETINLPESITEIKDGVFENCSSLSEITIPSSVISIGNEVFKGCTSLETINLPESITEIKDGVFENCSSLSEITIPNDGIPANKEEAVKYYKMAIEKGNSFAMNSYANMLYNGDGIPVNKEEAVKYYKMAAMQGNSLA